MDFTSKQLTVADLIEKLKECPPHALVFSNSFYLAHESAPLRFNSVRLTQHNNIYHTSRKNGPDEWWYDNDVDSINEMKTENENSHETTLLYQDVSIVHLHATE